MNLLNHFLDIESFITFNRLYVFKNFDFSKFKRLFSQFRTPRKEIGAVKLCNAVFPNIKDKNIVEEIPNHIKVSEANEKEVEVYCRSKGINQPYIDLDLLNKTILFVKNIFYTKGSYYSINNYEQCLEMLPKNTSSCYPNYVKKGNSENIKETINLMKLFDSRIRLNDKIRLLQSYPCTIFNRFTPKMRKTSNNVYYLTYKIRQIFGVSHYIVALEVKYFTYFIRAFKQNMEGITTLGLTKPEVSNLVGNVRNTAQKTNKLIMCGDISGCDKSIPSHFFRLFFAILVERSPNEYIKNVIISLGNYITYTPILRENEVKYSNGSTLSGSYITSVFTTFVIYFVICYCFIVLYKRFPNIGDCLVQGDDFIMLIDEGDQFLVKEIFKLFNLRIKVSEKIIVRPNEDVEFLGFLWDYDNEPKQSDCWLYSRIVYPEKSVTISGPGRIICRYISLIFQLRNYFDLFKRFVEYDTYLKKLCNSSSNPSVNIIDNLGNVLNVKIPIVRLLNEGWKMF